jgi:predicted RNA methylase
MSACAGSSSSSSVVQGPANSRSSGQMMQLLSQLTRSLADLEAPQHGLKMLQDGPLLAFYSSSLAAATAARPEATVLVLANGGGGLLALLAAAAGARRVVVAEKSRWGCRAAKQLVGRNAWAHAELVARIEVVPGPLSSCCYDGAQGTADGVDSAEDGTGAASAQYRLPCQADVVVTDLFDYSVLGQGLLSALHEAATLHLLAPDVLMVPQQLRVWGQLVSTALMEPVAGFDLSAMNRYRWHPTIERIEHARYGTVQTPGGVSASAIWHARRRRCTRLTLDGHTVLACRYSQLKPASGPVQLAELDLSTAAAANEPAAVYSSSTSLNSGCGADALLIWFELYSRHGHALSTAPTQQLTAEARSTASDSSSASAAAAPGLSSAIHHTSRYGAGLAYLDSPLTARPSASAVMLVAHRSPGSLRMHVEATAADDDGPATNSSSITWSPRGLPRHAWVPRWHFDMLADSTRNDAYDAAIRCGYVPVLI